MVSVMLLFQLFFVTVLALLLHNADIQMQHERSIRELTVQVNRVSGLETSAITGLLEELHRPDPPSSDAFHETYGKYVEALPEQHGILQQLGARTPYQTLIENMIKTSTDGLAAMEVTRRAYLNDVPEKSFLALECKQISDARTHIKEDLLSQAQRDLQAELEKENQTRLFLSIFLASGLVLNVGWALALVLVFTKQIVKRIDQMRENAVRLAAGKPLTRASTQHDELGELDSVFHKMAASLAEAIGREQAMLINAVDMICMLDANGVVLDVNPAATVMLGFEKDQLMGRRWVDLVPKDERDKTFNMIQDAVEKQTPCQFENRLLTARGVPIDVGCSVHWSVQEKALFCVVRDITQRKHVDRLKQDFVAMVSHDLKAPLTSIQLVLDTLAMGMYGEISATGNERLNSATASIERLIALVNGLLSIEKLESGDVELDSTTVKASEIVEPSVQSILGLTNAKSIKIKVEAPDQDLELYGDRHRLIQVLVNLLSNAIKFSPERESIVVKVSDDQDSVRFEIIDRGRGVPAAMQSRIFERFKQMERSDETEKGGSGFGLSICQAIVRRHGGDLGVTSDGTTGSTFWFSIPKLPQTSNNDKTKTRS